MCMWISQEAGSSWECAEHANIRSTLISDQGKSLYLHLPSQTWLTRSLKTANSSLLPVAFYLLPSRLAIYWQDLLARSNLCAQQVHSHDTDVEYRRQLCQWLFFQIVPLCPCTGSGSPCKKDMNMNICIGTVSENSTMFSIISVFLRTVCSFSSKSTSPGAGFLSEFHYNKWPYVPL